jgi:hypothetical protein
MESGSVAMQENEVCPYIARMGVCLEPSACSLKHKTMNLGAKEFHMPSGVPEYDPNQIDSGYAGPP